MSIKTIFSFTITPANEDSDLLAFISRQPGANNVELIASMRYDPCESNRLYDNSQVRKIMAEFAAMKQKPLHEMIAAGLQIGSYWAQASGGQAFFLLLWI